MTNNSNKQQLPQGDFRPIPDPTELTTRQLLREVESLRDLIFTRIEAIEKAIIVSHDDMVRVPTMLDKAVVALRELVWSRFDTQSERFTGINESYTEKFTGIQNQFKERDTRVDQTAKASKEALDAALQAAKEAVGEQNKSNSAAITKSETAVNKQIDALGVQIQQSTKTSDDKMGDLKDRITAMESIDRGGKNAISTHQASNSSSMALIGLIISNVLTVIVIVISVFGGIHK